MSKITITYLIHNLKTHINFWKKDLNTLNLIFNECAP